VGGAERHGGGALELNGVDRHHVARSRRAGTLHGFIPTPPTPMTTTVSPVWVPAHAVADPQPVVTPHDTREPA